MRGLKSGFRELRFADSQQALYMILRLFRNFSLLQRPPGQQILRASQRMMSGLPQCQLVLGATALVVLA